jgi:hypothetical protein
MSCELTTSSSMVVSLPASFMLWLVSPEARFLKGKFLWSNWDCGGAQGPPEGARVDDPAQRRPGRLAF